jgi:hypothetical protein
MGNERDLKALGRQPALQIAGLRGQLAHPRRAGLQRELLPLLEGADDQPAHDERGQLLQLQALIWREALLQGHERAVDIAVGAGGVSGGSSWLTRMGGRGTKSFFSSVGMSAALISELLPAPEGE